METVGLGAGSYPEPRENNLYTFTAEVITKAQGYVIAKTNEEAENLIKNKEYLSIETSDFKQDIEIENICDMEAE